MSDTLRFKPSLVNGSWPDNPEPLVRCSEGDYCLYSDYKKLEAERDALKEFKQGVYQYLRECQPSTKEEIELYESFSHFIRSLDN